MTLIHEQDFSVPRKLRLPEDFCQGSPLDLYLSELPFGGETDELSELLWIEPQVLAWLDEMNALTLAQIREGEFYELKKRICMVSPVQIFLHRHCRRGGRRYREALVRCANRAYAVRMVLQYTVVGWSDINVDKPLHSEMLPSDPRPGRPAYGGSAPVG